MIQQISNQRAKKMSFKKLQKKNKILASKESNTRPATILATNRANCTTHSNIKF